jgi:murein DD-endopeptidase MepM/ murein hydrolase activator NlpD
MTAGSSFRIFALSLISVFSALLLVSCSTINKSGYFERLDKDAKVSTLAKEKGVSELRLIEFNPDLSEIVSENAFIEKGSLVYIPKSKRLGLLDRVDLPTFSVFSSSSRVPKGKFVWPLENVKITSNYGRRGIRRKMHEGLDLKASRGTPIYSSAGGKVIFSGRLGGYGKTVIIAHSGGYRTVYAHNSRNVVRKGQRVDQGEKIAHVGSTGRSTGPHLHFEIRKGEKPLNPGKYLAKK